VEQLEDNVPGSESPPERSDAVERLRVAASALERLETRPAAAKRLNALLTGLAQRSDPADRPALSASLLTLLDEPQFKLAADDDGGSCRVNAVGALLAFGYPFALQLHPDDLAFYRHKTKPRSRRWVAVIIVALLTGLGLASAVAVSAESRPVPRPPIEKPPPVVTPKVTQTPVVPEATTFVTPSSPAVRPLLPSLLDQTEFAVTVRGAKVSLASKAISEYVVLERSSRPEVRLATFQLVQRDVPRALTTLEQCVAHDPCTVLKIIALRMRDENDDLVVAEGELAVLRQRSPQNPSLSGLQKLLDFGTSR
jgi:hypothetical protein